MVAIQEIGPESAGDRTRACRHICQHYPGWMLQSVVFCLFAANAINIGADLGAMGDATKLLVGGPTTDLRPAV